MDSSEHGFRMARRVAVLVLVLALSVVILSPVVVRAPPPPPEWEPSAPMPVARAYFGAAELRGEVYAAGGLVSSPPGVNVTAEMDAYDPATDRWTRVADLPEPRWGHVLVSAGDQLYLAGGSSSPFLFDGMETQVYAYDPTADTWAPVAAMPEPRTWAAGFALGWQVHVWGGSPDGSTAYTDSMFAYDPGMNLWSSGPSMPFPRSNFAAAVVGDRAYLTGGWRNLSNTTSFRSPTYAWEDLAPMIHGRGAHASAELGGAVWAIGGVTADTSEYVPSTSVERYDPGTDTWTSQTPYPAAVHSLSAVRAGTVLYAMGGINEFGSSASLYALIVGSTTPPSPAAFLWLLGALLALGVAAVAAFAFFPWRAGRRSPRPPG